MNPTQRQKQIELNRQILKEYHTANDDKIAFNILDTNENCTLNIDIGQYFNYNFKNSKIYFNREEFKKLSELIIKFEMPENVKNDLILSYLNMRFAALLNLEKEFKEAEINKRNKVSSDLIDFFDSIVSGKFNLVEVTMLATNQKDKKNIRITIKNDSTTSSLIYFFNKCIEDYENNPACFNLKISSDQFKKKDPLERVINLNKNLLKERQGYYCKALFEYLNLQMFPVIYNPNLGYTHYKELQKKENKNYPVYNRLLFIGHLMFLSGLLQNKKPHTKQQMFDLINKKLKTEYKNNDLYYGFLRELHNNPPGR